jgi:putative transposase
MVRLIFNATVRAEGPGLDGFYRVVAVPPGGSFIWLAFLSPRPLQHEATPNEPATAPGTVTRACRELLRSMEVSGSLAEVTLEDPGTPARAEQMKASRKLQWDTRCIALARLLDHDAICESLQKRGRLGPLVRAVSMSSGLHRATVYRMWIQLCQRGFTNFGLVPQYFRCGAPGAARPVNELRLKAGRKSNKVRRGDVEPFPQRGVTADDRDKLLRGYLRYVKPGTTRASIYRKVIEAEYVTQYDITGKAPVGMLPTQGSYPTLRQFRNIVDFETKAYERSRLLTTAGHFNRNMRGLRGHAHDNVAGPGYVYAIDSTIGDIHRGSPHRLHRRRRLVDRHCWLLRVLGRPVVADREAGAFLDVWRSGARRVPVGKSARTDA